MRIVLIGISHHRSTNFRSSVMETVSSLTAGWSRWPLASRGKYRTRAVGRLKTVNGSATGWRRVTRASARRHPCAGTLAPKRVPGFTGEAAGLGAACVRV